MGLDLGLRFDCFIKTFWLQIHIENIKIPNPVQLTLLYIWRFLHVILAHVGDLAKCKGNAKIETNT